MSFMDQAIHIVNFPGMPLENLFWLWDRDDRSKPFVEFIRLISQMGNCALHQNGWNGDGLDDDNVRAVILINSDLDENFLKRLSKIRKNKCFLILLEPPAVDCYAMHYESKIRDFFGTILTQFDDLIDNRTYVRLNHWQARERVVQNAPAFSEKKFCTMIQTNRPLQHVCSLSQERADAAQFFSRHPDFDLFGVWWDGFAAWRGYLNQDKLTVLKNYKFVIGYENMKNQRGFFTERIFDAFYAKCVPIYWGATNIGDYIPPSCFIHRPDFASNEELDKFLVNMDPQTYESYINAAQEFLKSPYAKEHFCVDSFGRRIVQIVSERAI
jgi:hypothetical protein